MDKKELKNLISNFSNNDQVTIKFRISSPMSSKSGVYTVLNVKKGKGKGGSLLAELVPENGDSIVVGTPNSDDILNVFYNGALHGYESEDDVPLVIKSDASQASVIKEVLRSCESGSMISLSSTTMPEFNGVFKIVSIKSSKGRFGQLIANLKNSEEQFVELWSYRHSGAINNIEKV